METNIYNLQYKIDSNNSNNLLFSIICDLQQILNYTQDNIIIKRIGDIIVRMNYIINENNKNTQLIRDDISKMNLQINKKFEDLKINIIKSQELSCENGKYVGQVINGKREGKGTYYMKDGAKYQGDWIKDRREGQGIEYFNNGERYEGNFKAGMANGKGVYYHNNGNRYEGDYKNNKREGQGIMYYNNGDRKMGDYFDDKPIGKHVILTKSGDVKVKEYTFQ